MSIVRELVFFWPRCVLWAPASLFSPQLEVETDLEFLSARFLHD